MLIQYNINHYFGINIKKKEVINNLKKYKIYSYTHKFYLYFKVYNNSCTIL